MTPTEALNELALEAHSTAISHGWWDTTPSFPESICMIHSELSEAVQEYRSGRPVDEELADVMIRVLDLAGQMGFDIGRAVTDKMEKNKDRPYRHGGKLC